MTQLALKSELAQCTPRQETGTTQLVLAQCIPRQVQNRETGVELLVLAQCIPRREKENQELQVLAQCTPRLERGRRKLLVLARDPRQEQVRRRLQVQARCTSIQAPLTRHRFVPTQTSRTRNVHNDQPWSTHKQLHFVAILRQNGHGGCCGCCGCGGDGIQMDVSVNTLSINWQRLVA